MDKTSQTDRQEGAAGSFDWQRLLFLSMLAVWAFAIYWALAELLAVLTLKHFLLLVTLVVGLMVVAVLRR